MCIRDSVYMNQRIAKKLQSYMKKKKFNTDDFNDVYRIALHYIIQFTNPESNVLSVYGQYISDITQLLQNGHDTSCLLYTSDAADERSSVDLGGRRIIKKKRYLT